MDGFALILWIRRRWGFQVMPPVEGVQYLSFVGILRRKGAVPSFHDVPNTRPYSLLAKKMVLSSHATRT